MLANGHLRSSSTFALAGCAVIVAGVLFLCLSALVARTGSWWQGTFDAFGVGFVVGGVIDVLAIFGLNEFASREAQRREMANQRALEILESRDGRISGGRGHFLDRVDAAESLLKHSWGDLDPKLRARLAALTDRYPVGDELD